MTQDILNGKESSGFPKLTNNRLTHKDGFN